MPGVLVHEWIAPAGGSENVLEAMSRIYPEADIVCLWNDSAGRFSGRRVTESWLARSPLRRSKVAALPFMPVAWRGLANRDYDWALISSHLFAHHVRFNRQDRDFRRFVYVHTPARYLWNPELDARGSSIPVRAAASLLRPLDRRRAQAPTAYAANSRFVRTRIRAAWGVDARVIYPPVDIEQIQSVADWATRVEEPEAAVLAGLPGDFVFGASRFIPYKRLDLVIKVGETVGRPVVLAGHGPELPALRAAAATASVPVRIVESPSTELLYALYQAALLYVFPAVEDFGIMPVEAMAAGAPVLGPMLGGAAESVEAGRTGALVDFASANQIRAGFDTALATRRQDRLERARRFSAARFADEITAWVGAA